MKTALIMKDRVRQIVLTPEDEDEEQILKMFAKEGFTINQYFGGFYLDQCRGGWLREYEEFKDKESLILTATSSAQKEKEVKE
jgi:hypothetical protein